MLLLLVLLSFLNILTEPVSADIVSNPQSVTKWIDEPEDVEFTCKLQITGDSNTRFYWHRAGSSDQLCSFNIARTAQQKPAAERISRMDCTEDGFSGSATMSNIFGERNFTLVQLVLTLKNEATTNEGEYRCGVLPSGESPINSDYANLNIVPLPTCSLDIQHTSNRREFTENDVIVMNCANENRGDPRSTLTWGLAGLPQQQVSPDSVQYSNWTSSYTRILDAKDNGVVIECTHKHPNINTPSTCTFSPLHVLYAPKVDVKQYNVSTNSSFLFNYHVFYKCDVDGNPKTDIQVEWFVDGNLIDQLHGSDRFIVTGDGSILHVLDDPSGESPTQDGVLIECRANNSVGANSVYFKHFSYTDVQDDHEPVNTNNPLLAGVAVGCLFVGLIMGVGLVLLVVFILNRRQSTDEESDGERTPHMLKLLSSVRKQRRQKRNRYELPPAQLKEVNDSEAKHVKETEITEKYATTSVPSSDNGVYTALDTSGPDDFYEPINIATISQPEEEAIYENT